MEEKEEEVKKERKTGKYVAIFIIATIICLLLFLPGIINDINELNQSIHEEKLLSAGKTTSASTIANNIMKALQNREQRELDKYLAKDFVYIDNSNMEHNYIRNFWDDLQQDITNNSYLEKRSNSYKDEETYWIYWNIPEGVTKNQYSQYALQRIFIYLRKTVKENEITYQVYKIILRDN